MQSRAEAGLEPLRPTASSPPTLPIPTPVQVPRSSRPLQPATTGSRPRTPTADGLPPIPGERTPPPPQLTELAATAGGTKHAIKGSAGNIRPASKATSANGTVPSAVKNFNGKVAAHTANVGDAATAADCTTICQLTPAARGDTANAAAVADDRPPLDRGAPLDTGGSPGARRATTVNDQIGAFAATKAFTGDARGAAGGGEFGTRIEPRVATTANAGSVTDTRRERAAPRGSPGRSLCVLRGLLVAPMVHLSSCPHRLHLPCYAALHVRAATHLSCPACRATVTAQEADRRALQQRNEGDMAEAMAVVRRAIPTRGGWGSSTRPARNRRGGRAIRSTSHGLVEEASFVQVPCSCDVHRRCALGFAEKAVPRARVNGANTLAYWIMCPNPTPLHEVHLEADLEPLLDQIRSIGRSMNTAEERAIRARITTAELRL